MRKDIRYFQAVNLIINGCKIVAVMMDVVVVNNEVVAFGRQTR